MSFLAPLYLLATIAIGLPIAFHMIRRSPQGKQLFSSVMFLTPDPPQVTRRSRIEDWLLLLLRAAAICLLAFAFARPFLRAQESIEPSKRPGRYVTILLDVSASMRREDCWAQARQAVVKLMQEVTPADTVSLTTFDSQSREIVSFHEWKQLPVESRGAVLLDRVNGIVPGWLATHAGESLIASAEMLDELQEQGTLAELVLISDMQAGGGWDVLNGYIWPENVSLQLIPVRPTDPSNATLQLAAGDTQSEKSVRIRIVNSADSTLEMFQVGWRDPFASQQELETGGTSISLSLPPGQSRIVDVPVEFRTDSKTESRAPTRSLTIAGDRSEFDNVCHLVMEEARKLRVVYLGSNETTKGPNDLRFFLQAVFPKTILREVTIIDWNDGVTPPTEPGDEISWMIIGGKPEPERANWIRNWIESGGTALFVARDVNQAGAFYELLGLPVQPVEEAAVSNYAMLQQIDFTHPAFQQFNDPRFSDFTKIHVWKYRKVQVKSIPNAKVLATYDDGQAAFVEVNHGKGRLQLLTTGWNRDDSDLAVSSKFVPFMNALLEQATPAALLRHQKLVGDETTLVELGLNSEKSIVLQGEQMRQLSRDDKFMFDRPGFFRFGETEELARGDTATLVAVNLPPEESRTDPLSAERLTSFGVKLMNPVTEKQRPTELSAEQQRQLMNVELEARQQWWLWLVIVALAFIVTETLLAAWRGLSRPPAPVNPPL